MLVERYFKCLRVKTIRDQKAEGKFYRLVHPGKRLINCLVHILIKLSSWDFLCVLIAQYLKKLLSSPPLPSLNVKALCLQFDSMKRNYSSLGFVMEKKKKNPKQMGGHVLFSFSICLNFNCSYNYAGMYFFLALVMQKNFKHEKLDNSNVV